MSKKDLSKTLYSYSGMEITDMISSFLNTEINDLGFTDEDEYSIMTEGDVMYLSDDDDIIAIDKKICLSNFDYENGTINFTEFELTDEILEALSTGNIYALYGNIHTISKKYYDYETKEYLGSVIVYIPFPGSGDGFTAFYDTDGNLALMNGFNNEAAVYYDADLNEISQQEAKEISSSRCPFCISLFSDT